MPQRLRALGRLLQVSYQPISGPPVDKVLVVFTPSQSAWLEHVEGEPARKLDVVGAWMAQQPGVTVLYQNAGAWVLQVKP